MEHIQRLLARALVLALIIPTVNSAYSQTDSYATIQRGPNWRVRQKTTVEHGTNHIHRYTEYATGLNYTNSYGQLTESKEQITILPTGGAAATQGRHQVYFPPDIYNSVLEVVTPDGRHLKSRPLGVSYDDGSNTVFIATLKAAPGYLTSSNQVTYRDAFTGIKADLVCTYRRGGFECDLVFRAQPPTPADLGLDAAFSTLQLVTEFFDTADPQQIPGASDEWFGLQDTTLKFGKLTMTHGKAFAFNGASPSFYQQALYAQTPVYKTWTHVDGRTFLIESVPVLNLADDLDALPLTAGLGKPASSHLLFAASQKHFPGVHAIMADTNQILLATADFRREPGVVLDYNTIDMDQGDVTFSSGNTYFISAPFGVYGTMTFESGTVLKYDVNNSYIWDVGGLDCETSPDHPAVITSMDDDTVGETISGSSGSPATGAGSCGFILDGIMAQASTDILVHDMRFYYLDWGTGWYSESDGPYYVDFWNCQFINCGHGHDMSWGTHLGLHNVLYSGAAMSALNSSSGANDFVVTAEQVTADVNTFGIAPDSSWMTNSIILENVGPTATILSDSIITTSPSLPIFQTGGNANYYLASSSPFRNAGTTSITPDLLTALQGMTTYAPQDGSLPDNDGLPDLGYHYSVNEDSDYDGLPDAWEWYWFGNYSHTGSELDGYGDTILSDYQNGLDPNVIQFTIEATNAYVNTTSANVQLDIKAGVPSYCAFFVNQPVTTNWSAFSTTNLTVSLGPTDGVYTVVVGLKGCSDKATVTWQDYRLTLDRVAPVIAIANPTVITDSSVVVSKPYLQLQGHANEQLSSLSYDISNAMGLATMQNAFVTDQGFDTNLFDFTTNYFQAYDVPLTNGVNNLTLRVTDRAGNTTTTNFNVILDYSTVTTAPVVNLIWPQAGMALSGSSCTIRGTMSDETGTVVAQVVNGDGTATTINGLVERDNMFWIENVPLNGTSQITLQATNAAGIGTNFAFNVLPSSINLTIDYTPTGDGLWQPTGNLTGSVSDPTATVVVNGKTATVYPGMLTASGGYYWEADNVPVVGRGTATFDATGYSAPSGLGSGGTQANAAAANVSADEEAGPYWEITDYYAGKNVTGTDTDSDGYVKDSNESVINFASVLSTNYQGNIFDLVHGMDNEHYTSFSIWPGGTSSGWQNNNYTWTAQDLFCHFTDNSGTDSTAWDTGDWTDTYVPNRDVLAGGTVGQSTASMVCNYFGDNVHYQWTALDYWTGMLDHNEYWLTARTKVTLLTGGKAMINRQSLFCIQASATKYGWALNGQWTAEEIDPSSLQVLGKAVGSDGNLWVVLPDNSVQDLTVTAPARHYGAWATPQKYKLQIMVNGSNPLWPDHVPSYNTFCVGEKLNFAPYWTPITPPFADAVAHWTLPGTFVNTNPYPYCSAFYNENSAFLNKILSMDGTFSTYCWYVKDFQNQSASVAMNLFFPNGQTIFVSADGKFTIYRPSLVNFQKLSSPSICLYTNVSGDCRLGVGDAYGAGNVLYQTYVNSTFSGSQFSGNAGVTQVYDDQSLPDPGNLDGSNILDGREWYINPNPDLTTISPVFSSANHIGLSDGPWEKCNSSESPFTTLSLQFKDYARFKPDIGPGPNIFITLGKITWNVNARADLILGAWVLDPNSTVTGPTPDKTSGEFPYWETIGY